MEESKTRTIYLTKMCNEDDSYVQRGGELTFANDPAESGQKKEKSVMRSQFSEYIFRNLK